MTEWKEFYKFVDMANLRYPKEVTSENVRKMLPWFHEFEMKDMLRECDNVLAEIRSAEYE